MTPSELARRLGITNINSFSVQLATWARRGLLGKPGRGRYTIPAELPHTGLLDTLTSYSLVISERATRSIGAMDEIRHDRFVVAMLDLVKDPHGMGDEISLEGDAVQRGLTFGSLGTIVYVVDDVQELVTVLDVLWPGPPTQVA